MNETTAILIGAITTLSGVIVWLVKRHDKREAEVNKVLIETNQILFRVSEVLLRVEELLRNWRAR
jgi:hypothetical protein